MRRGIAAAAVAALGGSVGVAMVAPAAVYAHPTPSARPASAGGGYAVGGAVQMWDDGISDPPFGTMTSASNTTLSYPGGIYSPAFSPDGTRLVFTDKGGALVSMRADGSGVLVLDAAGGHSHPTWARGGAVVVSRLGRGLVSTPAGGGSSTPIPGTTDADYPSGDLDSGLAFVVNNAYQEHSLVYMDLGTGATTSLDWGQDFVQPSGSPFPGPVAAVAEPSLSPDGKTVAVTEPVTTPWGNSMQVGLQQIFTLSTSGYRVGRTQMTNNGQFFMPAFSPDGKFLAFNTAGGGIQYIPAGSPMAAPTAPGFGDNWSSPHHRPVWQPNPQPGSNPGAKSLLGLRLDGTDRVGTAVEASQWEWATHGQGGPRRQANAAVLSRSDLFADALSGSALAAHAGGPLLLTQTSGLNPAARAELLRTLAPGSPVYLLGGPAALSPAVESQVRAAGFTPVRLLGADRFETSTAVANQIHQLEPSSPLRALLATGQNFPDALAAGAAAGATPGGVVLLTADTRMPAVTSAWVTKYRPAVWAVGHQADDAARSVRIAETPLAGADRFGTAELVARAFFPAPRRVGLATSVTWPDALSGGALMGSEGGPLLLVEPTALPVATGNYLSSISTSVTGEITFGGRAAISDGAQHQAADAAGTPGAAHYGENDPNKR